MNDTLASAQRMIDQIARNLSIHGDEQAAEMTAAHIRRFWDPRMKAALLGSDLSMLSPVAVKAAALLQQEPG
ncbi:MAG: formate dehydrogenase subunit delta [Sphingomonadaceae bacterium]